MLVHETLKPDLFFSQLMAEIQENAAKRRKS